MRPGLPCLLDGQTADGGRRQGPPFRRLPSAVYRLPSNMSLLSLTPLSAVQADIQRLAREFAQKEIAPCAAAWDRDSHFEPMLIKQLGELGFLGMLVPEGHGGLGLDQPYLSHCTRGNRGGPPTLARSYHVGAQLATDADDPRPRQRRGNAGGFLAPMSRGELLGAFALSESDAGSDAASLRAQAVHDGDSWILDGTKSWVTCGDHAGVILAMVRTDTPAMRRGARGISTFIITPDLPGFKVGKKEDKMGLRASPTVQLVFDRMRVPGDRLVGEEGQGFVYAIQSLEHGRLWIAANAVGIARHALQTWRYAAYAGERRQFGRYTSGVRRDPVQARRHGRARPRGPLAAPRRRGCEGPRRGGRGAHVDGETRRQRSRDVGDHTGHSGLRRVWIREGLSCPGACSTTPKITQKIYEGTSEIQRIVIGRALTPNASENGQKLFETMSTLGHEQVVCCYDKSTGYRGVIAIHDTTLGPALGGCRFWNYASDEEAVVDALRLSRGMTYKNAVAGLSLGSRGDR